MQVQTTRGFHVCFVICARHSRQRHTITVSSRDLWSCDKPQSDQQGSQGTAIDLSVADFACLMDPRLTVKVIGVGDDNLKYQLYGCISDTLGLVSFPTLLLL